MPPDSSASATTPSPTPAPQAPDPQHARDGGSPDFPWPPILFLVTIFAAVGMQYLVPLSWPGLNDMSAKVIGTGFTVAGFSLAAWALLTMLRARRANKAASDQVVLITSGPFWRYRNPMYVGYALVLLGLADTTQTIWIAILTPAFMIAVTWLAILPEEHHLEAKFGQLYRDYKERTRRWI